MHQHLGVTLLILLTGSFARAEPLPTHEAGAIKYLSAKGVGIKTNSDARTVFQPAGRVADDWWLHGTA